MTDEEEKLRKDFEDDMRNGALNYYVNDQPKDAGRLYNAPVKKAEVTE
jgi:hypothetical protein